MVDSIEANVETASIRVNEGTDQLRTAERYQVWYMVLDVWQHFNCIVSEQGQTKEDNLSYHRRHSAGYYHWSHRPLG